MKRDRWKFQRRETQDFDVSVWRGAAFRVVKSLMGPSDPTDFGMGSRVHDGAAVTGQTGGPRI